MQLSLRIVLSLVLLIFLAMPASAKAPPLAAIARGDVIAAVLKPLGEGGDLEGARRKGEAASARFKTEGETWLAASYAVSAADYAMRMGDAARVDADYYPRMGELLATLEPVEETRANLLLELLMDAKGRLGDKDRQDALAELYEERIRKAHGRDSAEDVDARVRTAYSLLESQRLEEGRKKLRAALAASAKTELHAVTLRHYTQAARSFQASGLNDDAAELFREAEQTSAIRAEV